ADLGPRGAAEPRRKPLGDALGLSPERPRRVQGRPPLLSRRRRLPRPRRPDRREALPRLPADRRIRFLLHARGHAAHRRAHSRRGGRRHAGAGALPDVGEPGAVPQVHPARLGEDQEVGLSAYDVIVVGGGNAAFCAALAAREQGARVVMLERAPEDERGGNSRFTAGAMRVVYRGVEDLLELMPDLTEEERRNTDFGAYTEEQFFDDMGRVTEWRCDPDLTELLVKGSFPALAWMRKKGVRFIPLWGRQAFKIDGKFKFWGGLTVEAWGGGPGLIDQLTGIAKREGIEIRYGARAMALL